MGYSINACKQIVFMDGNIRRQIKEVWYCDDGNHSHKVWPCLTELREAYVVALSTNGQSYDTSSISYKVGQDRVPNVTLLPGRKYAVKGTVYIYDSEMNHVDTITDCYFHYETVEGTGLPGDGLYTTVDNTVNNFGSRSDNKGVSNSTYSYWTCTDDTGVDRGQTMQAYYDTVTYGPVQFNYVYDTNYTTPFVFKRATITESLVLAKSDISSYNNGSQNWDNYPILQAGSTITIYPKSYKRATADGWNDNALKNWEQLNSVSVTWDDPDNAFTVVKSGNYYNVTPTLADSQAHELTFHYGDYSEEMFITAIPQHSYSVYDGNTYVQSAYTLTSPKTFTIKESDWDESTSSYGNEHVYSGTVEVINSNTSAVTMSNNNRTVNPVTANPGQTSTIKMSVGGVQIAQFTVTVGQLQTVTFDITNGVSDMSQIDSAFNGEHVYTLSSTTPRSEYTNCYAVTNGQKAYFGIKFGTNNSFNNLVNVYIDRDGEADLYDLNNNREVEVYGDGSGVIYFSFTRISGQDILVDIPVYADSNYQNFLGTIRLTVYN